MMNCCQVSLSKFNLRHYDVAGAAPAVIASLTHAAAAAAAGAGAGTHYGGGGISRSASDISAIRAIAATVRELRHRIPSDLWERTAWRLE